MRLKGEIIGVIGLSSVVILAIALLVIGSLNSEFNFINDFISRLGAKGQPNALIFNLIGFVTVGLLLFIFGWTYGVLLKDKLLSLLLSLFGLGFAFTAIPVDLAMENAPVSKAHVAAICLGLAFWLFGLARMGYNPKLSHRIRYQANFAAGLLFVAMIGFVLEFWSMPITHRLVFGVVFGWTTLTSIQLISETTSSDVQNE